VAAVPCNWSIKLTYSAITNRGVAESVAIKELTGAARRCARDL
jgi:hypothetical protein